MRYEDQDPSADALRHERALIATARERASRSRAQAAPWSPDQAGPFSPPSSEEFTGVPLKPARDLLPGYELQREIRRGGQGVVYQALQRSTRRQVAIKVMKEGPFAGPDDKARFDREVRILAQLDHPSIVAIHDSGTAAGCFYFVMNYIAGPPLDAYVRDSDLTLQETLSLFVKISDAVNAAHLRGIVHRDLKPSNIRIDADGHPHVLDFGLAKVEDGSLAGGTIIPAMTMTGQFVGSLPWASPEQAAGVAGGIDVRSDVYSLGVVLYHMLTGTFPYDVRGSMLEVVHRIVHAEPIRPSAANVRGSPLRRVFGADQSDAPRFRINDEVETIVLKSLSKDRDRRYQNAGELARDIRHYLAGEAIEARRDSLRYFLRKHVQRHRLGFGFACTLLLVLVAGLIVSLAFWRQAATARTGLEIALGRADQREKDIRQVADAQAKMLSSVDPQTMGASLRDDLLVEAQGALGRAGADPEELASRLKQLESLLSGTNFTNLGVRGIDRNVLAPALKAIERDYAGQPLVQARLWQTIAEVYLRLGLYGTAVVPAEQALATHRRELGDDHPDTLQSMSKLAGILRKASKYVEAELYYREAMERRRRTLGDDHPDTLASINDLGVILDIPSKDSEVEPYLREALEGRRRVLGNLHRDTLESIGKMGRLLWSEGRLTEAEEYLREALTGYRIVFGNDHELTQTTILNMVAFLLEAQGRSAEADLYLRELVGPRGLIKGDDYSDTLAAIDKIAKTLWEVGKYAEAEPYIREAMEGRRRVQGDDHPDTLESISGMGAVLWMLGRLSEAEQYFREALERRRRVLGDLDYTTLTSVNNMGLLLTSAGRYTEAERYFREALEGKQRALGNDDRSTLRSMKDLGLILVKQERFAEAEPYFRRALEGYRRVLGNDDRLTLRALINLGIALRGLGRLEEAEVLGAEAVRRVRTANLPPNGLIGTILISHAKTLMAMERFEQAEVELIEGQEILARAQGRSYWLTIEAGRTLAELYDAWHAAEPGKGYDAKVAEWKAKLEASQPAASEPKPEEKK